MREDIKDMGSPREPYSLPQHEPTEEEAFSKDSQSFQRKPLNEKEELAALQEAMQNNPHFEFPDDEGSFEDERGDTNRHTAGDDSPVQINYNAEGANGA